MRVKWLGEASGRVWKTGCGQSGVGAGSDAVGLRCGWDFSAPGWVGGTQRLLGLVEGLDGQASAGENTAEAGLPSATGLRLNLNPHLDIGSLPVM